MIAEVEVNLQWKTPEEQVSYLLEELEWSEDKISELKWDIGDLEFEISELEEEIEELKQEKSPEIEDILIDVCKKIYSTWLTQEIWEFKFKKIIVTLE